MAAAFAQPVDAMQRALQLAKRGLGRVEPNPPVGAVIVNAHGQLVGEGWHARFGGPHAEVAALAQAGERARGATLYVTLEPCAHSGKTPPCAPQVVAAGIRKVVVAAPDPAPHTSGRGLQRLTDAGIDTEVGLLGEEAARLIAPFTKLMTRGLPWVHAKWAMTLDGKLATSTGDSKWISSEQSRQIVHELRGRMDAIVVGIGAALADDPQLTARPPGPRTPTRIVIDSQARLPLDSHLVRTARDVPVILAAAQQASADRCNQLRSAGVEVLQFDSGDATGVPLDQLLKSLGQRKLTNLLVEGGARLLGSFFDARFIDEVHAFIAPALAGGANAPSPLAGKGIASMSDLLRLRNVELTHPGGDVYIHADIPTETENA